MIPETNLPAFTEAMRYRYPLSRESVIIEAGTHQGLWAAEMSRLYGCRLFTFEPIREFFQAAVQRLHPFPGVTVSNVGLASSNRSEHWKIKGDMTGAFNGEGVEEAVVLIDFGEWLRIELTLPPVIDLLEINIEGGEYELLEALLIRKQIARFKNIQVQFHGVGLTPVERRREIREQLTLTHHLTYDAPFVWENWERNA